MPLRIQRLGCPVDYATPATTRRALPGGCFANFDQHIRLDVVPSTNAHHLCLIPCN